MTFQVLSLSGGGFLGLYTAAVLAELENLIGGRIADRFDLIAGTSVGGIIALGLAAGKPASEIRDAFVKHGPSIFQTLPPARTWLGKKVDLFRSARSPKYSSDGLKAVIVDVVGAHTLVKDLQHRCMVPAVNLTRGRPQIFKTGHHKTFVRDPKLLVSDVALATSAAPTFFPLHAIGGELYADGGLYANAPDHLALHEAEHFLQEDRANIWMLSIGTTTSKFSFSNEVGTNLGWLAWMEDQRLPNVMIASQQLNTESMLIHTLGGQYVRIDQDLSPEQEKHLALDIATQTAIADLRGLAEGSIRDFWNNQSLQVMLARMALRPTFFDT